MATRIVLLCLVALAASDVPGEAAWRLRGTISSKNSGNDHNLAQAKLQQASISAPGSVTVAPRVIGLHLELPEPSYEDVSIARSVQHANETVVNFVEHTARFNSMDAVATYLQKDAGITWLASYADLASCASSPWCSASWRTDPSLGGNNVTVTSVLRAFDLRNVTRCHVTSDEQEAYCHLSMPGMNEWAYFALAVPSNASSMNTSPLPLALVCHGFDASLISQLSAEKAALAAKYPSGIYCHPMNGHSFLATASTYNASNRSDLEVSASLPSQSVYSVRALGPPNY